MSKRPRLLQIGVSFVARCIFSKYRPKMDVRGYFMAKSVV